MSKRRRKSSAGSLPLEAAAGLSLLRASTSSPPQEITASPPPQQAPACSPLRDIAATSASVSALKTANFHQQAIQLASELDTLIGPLLKAHPVLSRQLAKDLAHAFQTALGQTQATNAKHPHYPRDEGKSLPKTYAEAASPSPDTGPSPQKQQKKNFRPPLQQEKEDAQIMVRLPAGHPIRSEPAQAVRAKVNSLTKAESPVKDVHHVASGLALVAKTPAKAAEILQNKEKIKNALGADKVEQQEKWVSFLLAPIPCRIFDYQGKDVVTEVILQQEINLATDITPCRVVWTCRSLETLEPNGTVIVSMTSAKARAWPGRLRLFGQAVSVQPLRPKLRVATCDNCYGFHHSRNCARPSKCSACGNQRHNSNCKTFPRCLNCCGPHNATDLNCLARPSRRNGALIKPTSKQLQAIRASGSAAWRLLQVNQPPASSAAVVAAAAAPEAEPDTNQPTTDRCQDRPPLLAPKL